MKRLLFALLPVTGFSQDLPHWESSCYVYEKENNGYDCFNVPGNLFEMPSGGLLCQPYHRQLSEVGNVQIQLRGQPAPFEKYQLNAFFHKQQIDWYGYSHGFEAYKKGKNVYRFLQLCKSEEFITGYQWFGNTLYFITRKGSQKSTDFPRYTLHAFDGKKFRVLMKDADGMLFVYKQQQLFLIDKSRGLLTVSTIHAQRIRPISSSPFQGTLDAVFAFRSPSYFCVWDHFGYVSTINGQKQSKYRDQKFLKHRFQGEYLLENRALYRTISRLNGAPLCRSSLGSNFNNVLFSSSSHSFYVGTETDLIRIFPYIRIYPRCYYNSNCNSTYSLIQDSKGNIWAGSYQGALTVSDGNHVLSAKEYDYKWLAQGIALDEGVLIPAETEKGVMWMNIRGASVKVVDSVTVFSFYKSRDHQLYLGTDAKGLWYGQINDRLHGGTWGKVTSKEGLKQTSIITIAEDRYGNIWTGNSNSIAVYQPKTGKCKTWGSNGENKTRRGARSILSDSKGNLWFGGVDGRLYLYSRKPSDDLKQLNLKVIDHPLLDSESPITFLHQWRHFLLIGAKDKVLLFDLNSWNVERKIRVRYLNPQALNLKGTTEQNTCFTDFRDSTFWFSSSENIYRIDLKKWMEIPEFNVVPSITVDADSSTFPKRKPSEKTLLKPGQNAFRIKICYQSKDNMPRYVNGKLTKSDETVLFSSPNLQHDFSFSNLEAGEYVFHVRVCQQDGSYTVYRFPIVIERYLWQNGWFWAVLSLIPLTLVGYIFIKREQLKDRERQVIRLSLSALSNQFRPHYMLNALNGIAAQLDGKTKAKALITHLGESIDVLFQSAKSNTFTHSFAHEWKLVEHMIEIQRLLYIPDLQLTITGMNQIPDDLQLPTGLLQIPIENALLHGLRHKTSGEKHLTIQAETFHEVYQITVTDNGIGRKKSAMINRFTRHESGLANLKKMVELISQIKSDSITFELFDLDQGTQVQICIKKSTEDETDHTV